MTQNPPSSPSFSSSPRGQHPVTVLYWTHRCQSPSPPSGGQHCLSQHACQMLTCPTLATTCEKKTGRRQRWAEESCRTFVDDLAFRQLSGCDKVGFPQYSTPWINCWHLLDQILISFSQFVQNRFGLHCSSRSWWT